MVRQLSPALAPVEQRPECMPPVQYNQANRRRSDEDRELRPRPVEPLVRSHEHPARAHVSSAERRSLQFLPIRVVERRSLMVAEPAAAGRQSAVGYCGTGMGCSGRNESIQIGGVAGSHGFQYVEIVNHASHAHGGDRDGGGRDHGGAVPR